MHGYRRTGPKSAAALGAAFALTLAYRPVAAETPKHAAVSAQWLQCVTQGIATLDDGTTSADVVAVAIMDACRPELEEMCSTEGHDPGIHEPCGSLSIHRRMAGIAPAIAGKILQLRAYLRLAPNRPQ